MKYYKMIKVQEFLGVITSENFRKYNPVSGLILFSNENEGEYVRYENRFYRDYWMQPIEYDIFEFENVSIIEITEEEYNELHVIMLEHNEIPVQYIITELPPLVSKIPDIEEGVTVEYIKDLKINNMSAQCRQIIENGFDIILSDNESHHFSLDTQDQLNLITLSALADIQELIPYHADGELCKFYTAEEIKQIVSGATQFKMYHTTYYNALKNYINSLNTTKEIAAVTYGMELPEAFQSDVLKAIS